MNTSSLVIAVAGFLGLTFSSVYALDDAQNNIKQQPAGNQITMQKPQETNKAKGEAFLAANKTKPGVVALPSGLQYKIIVAGAGKKPGLNDAVTVHYMGTLIDGTKFDSSYDRKQPATFPLTAVIRGWTEALQLMNVGSTWELYIPSTLAYGSRGAPPSIGSDETLIFKVELIDIKK